MPLPPHVQRAHTATPPRGDGNMSSAAAAATECTMTADMLPRAAQPQAPAGQYKSQILAGLAAAPCGIAQVCGTENMSGNIIAHSTGHFREHIGEHIYQSEYRSETIGKQR